MSMTLRAALVLDAVLTALRASGIPSQYRTAVKVISKEPNVLTLVELFQSDPRFPIRDQSAHLLPPLSKARLQTWEDFSQNSVLDFEVGSPTRRDDF